ncbi:hypothetical protein BET10_12530 [Pseudoalteromonas amylolytica]|uniref:Uncharacterized protein n=1 Tax=Pseudoalteromonas amylolytica TaxID=1859457 RepID=A0A1S1MZM1_9GAMM|nr:hypothetical protein BFC16_12410 [Pseudoalteromonas sp. JW3]OHU91624.1 hypothetical protein BET10_12530 [Pseudoalteromonas amylolytica]
MIEIILFLALSLFRWGWLYAILCKSRNQRTKAIRIDIAVLLVQVFIGFSLERSDSLLAGFGFILVLITMFESMCFRNKT